MSKKNKKFFPLVDMLEEKIVMSGPTDILPVIPYYNHDTPCQLPPLTLEYYMDRMIESPPDVNIEPSEWPESPPVDDITKMVEQTIQNILNLPPAGGGGDWEEPAIIIKDPLIV
jgi:hypothetical protein